MGNTYFIINPQAKNGYALKVWHKLKEYLEKERYEFIFYLTKYPGHAIEIVNQICQGDRGEKAIIAIGGDGTIHEVMNGAVHSPATHIGFIPAGSGNDFRRGYELPKEIFPALQLVLQKEFPTYKADVGEVINKEGKKRYFINNMGAGFDAWVAKKVNESKMKKIFNRFSLGAFTYAYYTMKELFKYPLTDVTLTIDGKDFFFPKTWFVTVSNQPYYGGGMKIAPQAIMDDGYFNVTIVNQLHPLKFLLMFVTVFWGRHLNIKELNTFQGKSIRIQSTHPLTAHADGEYMGESPLTVSLYEKEVSIITNYLRLKRVLDENNN